MASRNEELPFDVEIRRTEESLHIFEALAKVMQEPHALLDLVLQADDAEAARGDLRERFALDEVQATAALDLQFRRASRLERQKIAERIDELIGHLAHLESLRP